MRAIDLLFCPHLILHACVQTFDVMFLAKKIFGSKHGRSMSRVKEKKLKPLPCLVFCFNGIMRVGEA